MIAPSELSLTQTSTGPRESAPLLKAFSGTAMPMPLPKKILSRPQGLRLDQIPLNVLGGEVGAQALRVYHHGVTLLLEHSSRVCL